MDDRKFLIYKFTSPSGKSYIGQTCNLYRREIIHRNTRGCRAFSDAIKKYGWDSFAFEILAEDLNLTQANDLEIKLISSHGTLAPNGYNLVAGGRNGLRSDETKTRMSIAQSGKTISDDARLKMSLAKIGKQLSDNHKESLSRARIGRVFSDETKAKISASLKGKKHSTERRANISAGKKKGPLKRPIDQPVIDA